ncbi:NAD(+) synthase [Saccharospirillum sp. MSK14-1]|uniref:NAD(+) synthase n=1 Tax=Saccharospirillum sp. MSK14-1 TaxID=1897632 RepID=UPI000D39B5F8|nr:NAD(+) synthase [Saccharospirillum sp. MSK14-1]PTY38541.1 NAD(+) synthase [Saccharospirillum sp. MSK14-1]
MDDKRELDPELNINFELEVDNISRFIRESLASKLHRRGLVVGMSGGIDSSVCAALAVKAIGAKKVFGILMPEHDSSGSSTDLGGILAEHLGIEYVTENISSSLEAIGCYSRRDEAIRDVIPYYDETWKSKIAISDSKGHEINHFSIVAQDAEGNECRQTLPLKSYLQIVAATNFKQRLRKTMEYYYADQKNYAVVGTPNRLEYDQGFFVKNGDGSADIKPIAHLYKTQVYALARYLELPDSICSSIPTTDTYSLSQGQDEFYFSLPYPQMDIALLYFNQSRPAKDLAKKLNFSESEAINIYRDIVRKRRTTEYLHMKPLTLFE